MFQGKVRVRGCGLLIEGDSILLLKHHGLGIDEILWSPPGGGVEFGEDVRKTVRREFAEETGLEVNVGDFLFINEHIDSKHHAIELFFKVTKAEGNLKLGVDPELKTQILADIRFLNILEIRQLPSTSVHSVFSRIENLNELLELRGYYKFANFNV